MYVRRSTAAQYAATKVTTKAPTQGDDKVPDSTFPASIGFFDGSARDSSLHCCNSVTFAGPQLSVNETVYPKERSLPSFEANCL